MGFRGLGFWGLGFWGFRACGDPSSLFSGLVFRDCLAADRNPSMGDSACWNRADDLF